VRIAIFSDNFYPELSGISDSIVSLAEGLAERGHKIIFFVPKYSKKNYKLSGIQKFSEPNLSPNIQISRFSSLPFPGSGTKQARIVIPGFWRWLKVKKFKPDIIHSNHFFGVGLEALIAAKILHISFVGTNHTAITEFVHYSPIKLKNLESWSEYYVNWYYNKCAFVSAPSQSLLSEMEKNGLRASHGVISNPIDDKNFLEFSLAEKSKLKESFGLSNHTIVYAGRFAEEKHIDILVRGLKQIKSKVPDAILALAGHGNVLDKIKTMAREIGVGESVKFLGTIDKPTMAKIYNASEIFTIASTSEVQSMTILQAMACGLAAVGANSRGIADCITDNGLLFEPNNYMDFAEKVITIFEDQNLRQKLSQNALAIAAKFSSAKIAEEWEKIYTKLINKN
jgi:glycosyltransferase involved in cell wall biosynthesis